MTRYLLDTNAVIALLNAVDSPLALRARQEKPSDIAISAIVAHELFYGAFKSQRAAQNVALGANPARHLERIGMKVVTHEPMVWLREMALTVVAASDRRTARIEVYDHDADTQGERRPVPGADVLVSVHGADDDQATSIRIKTNEAGIAGFSIPADLPLARFAVSVRHDDFNPRHIRLDGTSLGIDLRQELYGNRSD